MSKYVNRMRFSILVITSSCIAFLALSLYADSAAEVGRFENELIVKALPDGSTLELVQPFTYVDGHNVVWSVPARTLVDGASIPRALWSIIGPPFTGKYREASVIHDYYCVTRSRHWKAVHRVFLDGMLARGVDKFDAQLMYIAVYRFGPRWDFDADACFCDGCPPCAVPQLRRISEYRSPYNAEDFDELRGRLRAELFTLEQLEDIAEYQINTEIFKPAR